MTIYCYSRFSVDDGSGNSVSIASQREAMENYAAHRWPNQPTAHVSDDGISGGVPLSKRPRGGPMLAALVKGDDLVAHRTDRLFRSVADGAARIVEFSERGINLHLLDLGMDTSTPMGRAMAQIAIVFAELERERCGERRRIAAAHRRSQGQPTMAAAYAPLGWSITESGGRRLFAVDNDERVICDEIYALRLRGFHWHQIAARLNRDERPRRNGRQWTRPAVRRAAIASCDGVPVMI